MPENPSLLQQLSGIELPPGTLESVGTLLRLMKRLRSPGGCPWDADQTHESLLKNVLEETYEFIHAVQQNDEVSMREELGDMFLQVVFQAQVAAENGTFNLKDVTDSLVEKLIRRHRHVFGDVVAENSGEALDSWNNAKYGGDEVKPGIGDILPPMPALMKARKIQDKAARVGFEWPDITGVLDKLDEEISELRQAISAGDSRQTEEELGDVLFVLANAGRHLGLCSEIALTATIDKFVRRFNHIERRLAEKGISPEESTLAEMDLYWDEAKKNEREV